MTIARIQLSFSGHFAELSPDDLTETGVVLRTGPSPDQMAEQSHVEVEDPSWLLHDYTHRMSSVLRAVAPRLWGEPPASVLHLGAGALTLPRWIQAQWPDAGDIAQTVVDIEPELVDFVLEHLPMPVAPENVVADAAEVLAPGGALAGRRFDVIIVDLFNSAEAPASLVSAEFFGQVSAALNPQGLLLMNLGDDAGMEFAREVTSTLLAAVGEPESSLLTGPDAVLSAHEEGNLVFAAVPGEGFTDFEGQLIWAAGPHPGEVLTGEELTDWVS